MSIFKFNVKFEVLMHTLDVLCELDDGLWNIIDTKEFDNDNLLIARKKETNPKA